MTRTDSAVYLHMTYAALEQRLVCFQGGDGYAGVINAALRDLGFAESELATAVVPDEDVPVYLPLLDYYALRKYLLAAATLTNTVIDGVPINRGALMENVKMLYEDARRRAVSTGYLPDTTAPIVVDMETGRLNLDFLEPALS